LIAVAISLCTTDSIVIEKSSRKISQWEFIIYNDTLCSTFAEQNISLAFCQTFGRSQRSNDALCSPCSRHCSSSLLNHLPAAHRQHANSSGREFSPHPPFWRKRHNVLCCIMNKKLQMSLCQLHFSLRRMSWDESNSRRSQKNTLFWLKFVAI